MKTFFAVCLATLCCLISSTAHTQNLALGKKAYQSSTPYPNMGQAGKAVDGNTDGNWSNGSVTHTNSEANPWWEVDLGAMYDIEKIRVWNRTDCCSERLHYHVIEFFDEGHKYLGQINNTQGAAGKQMLENSDIKQKGRFVRITLYNGPECLSLAEVEIFGNGYSDAGKYIARVELDDLKCIVSGDGNGEETEYYGSIWVSERVATSGHWFGNLFKNNTNNTIDLSAGVSKLFPNTYVDYEFRAPRGIGYVADELILHAMLKDYDTTSGDDDCGSAKEHIRLNALRPGGKYNYTLNLSAEGDQSQVRFTVTVIKVQ